MDQKEQQILVLGLPETGKSSFIQALDEVLKHPSTPNALCSDGLAHDRTYIQDGKSNFLAGNKPERTDRQVDDTSVELWFRHPPTGSKGRLYLPDKKGEVFRDQWMNRRWDKEYRESLKGISGVLVFVRADEKSRNDERLGVLAQQMRESGMERPFEMKDASAQVQLVDIIQFIAEHSDVVKPIRIAVLISAWDTINGAVGMLPNDPKRFLEKVWALLAQYLRANPESFIFKVYGVSAYGGEPGNLGGLVDQAPHERVQLVDGNETSKDLTLPVRWLLQLD